MKNPFLPACILLCRPSLMAQRTLAAGFADTGIEKASAKSAPVGKYKISVNPLNPWLMKYSLCFCVLLAKKDADCPPPSTSVEESLQISPFYSKQTQFFGYPNESKPC